MFKNNPTGNPYNLTDSQTLLSVLAIVFSVFAFFSEVYKDENRLLTATNEMHIVTTEQTDYVVSKIEQKTITLNIPKKEKSQLIVKPKSIPKKIVKHSKKVKQKVIEEKPVRQGIVVAAPTQKRNYSSYKDTFTEKAIRPKLLIKKDVKRVKELPVPDLKFLVAKDLTLELRKDLLGEDATYSNQGKDIFLAAIIDTNNVMKIDSAPVILVEKKKFEEPKSIYIPINTYKAEDFVWKVNKNYIKKKPNYTKTLDGKVSYVQVSTGTLFKVDNIEGINAAMGIFVERSEDEVVYESIGIINPNASEKMCYLDVEPTTAKRIHYRLRAVSNENEEVIFGNISISPKNDLKPLDIVAAFDNITFSIEAPTNQVLNYQVKEAKTGIGYDGSYNMKEGFNDLKIPLIGNEGLYSITLETNREKQDFLFEKLNQEEEFITYHSSGKQNFQAVPRIIQEKSQLNFDFFIKGGSSLFFDGLTYKDSFATVKSVDMENLSKHINGTFENGRVNIFVVSDIDYLHQKIPMLIDANGENVYLNVNIYTSKDIARPVSILKNGNWKIPGFSSCQGTELLVFDSYGNLVFNQEKASANNIFTGQKDGHKLDAGIYYYIFGNTSAWLKLES